MASSLASQELRNALGACKLFAFLHSGIRRRPSSTFLPFEFSVRPRAGTRRNADGAHRRAKRCRPMRRWERHGEQPPHGTHHNDYYN